MPDAGSIILVNSLESHPVTPIPSSQVDCSLCGRACWLSKKTGQDTIDVARAICPPGKEIAIVCDLCFGRLKDVGLQTVTMASPAALREAAEAEHAEISDLN